MAYFLSVLIKLTREELADTLLGYQHKFDKSLAFIITETTRTKNLIYSNGVWHWNIKKFQCEISWKLFLCSWAMEQYSRRGWLEISGIPESVNSLQGILRGIDTESCLKKHRVLSSSEKILKGNVKYNKKNIDHKCTGLPSGTKAFLHESLCGSYKFPWPKLN